MSFNVLLLDERGVWHDITHALMPVEYKHGLNGGATWYANTSYDAGIQLAQGVVSGILEGIHPYGYKWNTIRRKKLRKLVRRYL